MFRGKLTAVCQKEDYTKGGRPPIDVIIKFKASVLRRIYNLSFEQIEYQINDRLSFMRFLGLGLGDKVLDSRTLCDFENTLAEAEVMEELFCMFDAMLESEGLITHKGTIIDATFWMHQDSAIAVMITKESKTAKFQRIGKSPKMHQNLHKRIPIHAGQRKATKYISDTRIT